MFFELSEAESIVRSTATSSPRRPSSSALSRLPDRAAAALIPEDRVGDTFIIIVAAWAGPLAEGEKALKPIHEVAPVVAEFVGPMPYPALNSAFDALVPPACSTNGRPASAS